jgi:tetratricopeptide (TPR) repeat protein
MRTPILKVISACSLSVLLFSAPSYADDATDASKLYKAGQLNEALKKIDAVLAQKPKDAQMRFLKGIIFAEQNKSAEALSVFSKLTDDYPELPEPYNNLAVLYASSGQFNKASAALEMAIRTNPTYATAHENLGDVYAKLAGQSYDKALQLDSNNSNAKLKLNLVKNLVGNSAIGVNPKTAANNTTPVAPIATTTPTAAATPIKPVASEKTLTSDKNADKAKNTAAKENEKVQGVVQAWAKAWSDKNVRKYLSLYSKDFQTPKGETRSAWAEDRRSRIEGKGKIDVSIESPQISIEGNTATVRFRQFYKSDRLSSSTKKTLVLVQQDGTWLIKQERSGN